MKKLGVLIVVFSLLFVSACNKDVNPKSDTRTVTDMAGRQVELKKDIKRVVTSSWDVADIVISVLGVDAMDRLSAVGRTKNSEIVKALYAEQYPQIAKMPDIGGGKGSSYDVEVITSLNADVFIVNTRSVVSPELIENLEKAGIPTIVFTMDAEPMKTPQQAIKIIGEIFDKEERAKEITDFIDAQFALIRSKNLSKKEKKPTVYMEKGSGTAEEYDVSFATEKGWGGIMALAGGENIIKDNSASSLQVDPEYLITQDPDFIIVAGSVGWDGGKGGKPLDVLDEYSKRKGWDTLSAVKNGNFYLLSHSQSRNQMCFFPALFMAKTFYPEEFEQVEPMEKLKEFFDRFMLLDFNRATWVTQRKGQ